MKLHNLRITSPFFAAVSSLFLSVFLFAIIPTPARAQAPSGGGGGDDTDLTVTEEKGNKGLWEIITPGGQFLTKTSAIASISQHTYIIDGATRVYEVTIDTLGPVCARFYYIEPVTDGSPLSITKNVMERTRAVAEKVTERTGTDEVWSQVVKHYPDTTHAKTVEFRLRDKILIDRIYGNIHKVIVDPNGGDTYHRIIVREE